jgi:aspartyl-tRNA(Asn)/glutamyl-tRNA(Gln) amidotransferase subunit A
VAINDVHPLDLGIRPLASALRDGSLSARELTALALTRIEERNGGAPSFDGAPDAINAWASLDPEGAQRAAEAADARIAAGDESLLLGIPVGVKDLYAVAGRPLTASSRLRQDEVADADSAAWAALAEAGAVYIGQTHTHEFAAGGTTDQVGNPWDLTRSAGGSSGGSGAAIAAGMVPLALGTDTAGSLRIPAALDGISAFKPSFGRVPVDGVIPLSWTLDHAGPLARTIEDCAIAVSALSGGRRARDPFGVGSRAPIAVPTARSLAGVRVAVTGRPDDVDVEADVRDGYDRTVAVLRDLGAEIVELAAPADLAKGDYDTIFLAEARAYHRQYASRAEKYRPSVREFLAQEAQPISVDAYLAAQQRRLAVTAAWDEWFRTNRVDVVLEPTAACTAPERGGGYDAGKPMGGTDPLTAFTATWNVTGFPVAALPAGLGERTTLPVGVSLIGRFDDDENTLAIAIALQEHLPMPKREW